MMANARRKIRVAGEWARRLWRLATCGSARGDFKAFLYDWERLEAYAGDAGNGTEGRDLARLILASHVVEKGLAMPNRRLGFGKEAVRQVMRLAEAFERDHGKGERMAEHAAAVVRTYLAVHDGWEGKAGEEAFWEEAEAFGKRHPGPPGAGVVHVTKAGFYAEKDSPFPAFAASRHTVRDYGPGNISLERLRAAAELAATAPSACNRQYARVHCVADKRQMERLLSMQNGNRGFGHLADKLLVVTVDVAGLEGAGERNDLFTNGGLFLMNLSYALHYHGIAHCILNCSRMPDQDIAIRQAISLRPSESLVAMLTCGEAPAEFNLAESPRKRVEDIWVVHPGGSAAEPPDGALQTK